MAWAFALSAMVGGFSLLVISMRVAEKSKRVDNNKPNGSHKKWNSHKSDGTERDYLSELPDDILTTITSYMSVRGACKMRVLSRRWRYVNVLGSHLNLSSLTMFNRLEMGARAFKIYLQPDYCVRVVNQIVKHYMGQSICSFRVAFSLGKKFTYDIDRWISFAVTMGVQDLKLFCETYLRPLSMNYPHDEMYAFSTQLLSEASRLKYLRLHSCKLKPDFSGKLYSLKVLVLSCIPMGKDDVQYILSTFMNLEDLRLIWCFFPGKLSVVEPLIQLKSLTVDHPLRLQEVELSTDKLTTFEYIGPIIKFSFSRVPNLENVFWILPCMKTHLWDKLARHVNCLQCLSVGGPVNLEPCLPGFPTTFRNVMQLDFFLFHNTSYDLLSIIPLLRACPLLQKLRVMMMYSIARELLPAGKSIHTKLKQVEFGGFYGCETQINLVVYLLETAITLERMTLSSRFKMRRQLDRCSEGENQDPMDEGKRKWVVEQLRGKAASNIAEVTLESLPII